MKEKKQLAVVILAAGESTRMGGVRSKALLQLLGKPLLSYVLNAAVSLKPQKVVVVVGKDKEKVTSITREYNAHVVVQEKRLGTGHAFLTARDALKGFQGTVLVLMGDTPLLKGSLLRRLVRTSALCAVASAHLDSPGHYGRIIRDADDSFVEIKEARHLSPKEQNIKEVNTGVYAFQAPEVWPFLEKLKLSSTSEYYLTDVPGIMASQGLKVEVIKFSSMIPFSGVNTPADFHFCLTTLQREINEQLMNRGVIIHHPESTWISPDARVEKGVEIFPYTFILGKSKISAGAIIGPHVYVENSSIGAFTQILAFTHLEGVRIGRECLIGPYARLRPGTRVDSGARVGNFVEMKNTTFGQGSKANHLTYLGDATVGKGVNVGAGVITCNYDGVKKHPTFIGDGAFIGSDCQLVAPVKIGQGAYIGAGSTITKDVPPGALGISRAPQKNIEGYARKKRKKGS